MDLVQGDDRTDRATQIAALLSGQQHTMQRVSQDEINILRNSDDIIFVKHWPGFFHHVGFNVRLAKMSDPRMRTALNLVNDQPGIGAAIFGNDEDWRYLGPLPHGYPEAIPQSELAQRPGFRSPTDADIAQAKSLMDAAGYGNGGLEFTIRLLALGGSVGFLPQAEHLIAQVLKFLPGNKIDLNPSSYTDMLAAIAVPDFDAYVGGWSLEQDAVTMMGTTYPSDGTRAFTGYASPQMDALWNSALGELDLDARADILREMQELAITDMPVLLAKNGVETDAYRSEVHDLIFHDFSTSNNGGVFLRYTWLD